MRVVIWLQCALGERLARSLHAIGDDLLVLAAHRHGEGCGQGLGLQ
jgi:hypothetical protein